MNWMLSEASAFTQKKNNDCTSAVAFVLCFCVYFAFPFVAFAFVTSQQVSWLCCQHWWHGRKKDILFLNVSHVWTIRYLSLSLIYYCYCFLLLLLPFVFAFDCADYTVDRKETIDLNSVPANYHASNWHDNRSYPAQVRSLLPVRVRSVIHDILCHLVCCKHRRLCVPRLHTDTRRAEPFKSTVCPGI